MTSAASGLERLRHFDLSAQFLGLEQLQVPIASAAARDRTWMRVVVAVFSLAALSCDLKTPELPEIEPAQGGNVGEANSARRAATADDRSRTVRDMDALEWEWDETHSAALLRFPQGPVVFSVSCDLHNGTVSFSRFGAAPQAGQATLSLTTPKRAASLPMTSVTTLSAPSSYWKAAAPVGELDASVIKLFGDAAPIRIAAADTSPLLAPPSDLPLRAFRHCR